MVRTACSDRLQMQKDPWDVEEDEKTLSYSSKQRGTGNWTSFSKRSVQRRNGRSSRENRWGGDQKTDPRHKSFTPREEELVIQLHAAIGSRWPIIAQQLPGRTENDVKILWNSKLRKKLSAMGIDPVTHKPFSQILADYGNIGAFPKARTRFTSLSRDLKNATILKSRQTYSDSDHHHFFSPSAAKTEPAGPSDHHSLDLYSQLQAVNLVTEASNHATSKHMAQRYMTECAPSPDSSPSAAVNQEISSFSWSDFLLEDAILPPDVNGQEIVECEDNKEGKQSWGAVEDKESGIALGNNSFEAASSSNSSSFLETMLESQDETMLESQDEVFPLLSGLYGEPFHY